MGYGYVQPWRKTFSRPPGHLQDPHFNNLMFSRSYFCSQSTNFYILKLQSIKIGKVFHSKVWNWAKIQFTRHTLLRNLVVIHQAPLFCPSGCTCVRKWTELSLPPTPIGSLPQPTKLSIKRVVQATHEAGQQVHQRENHYLYLASSKGVGYTSNVTRFRSYEPGLNLHKKNRLCP